MKLIIELDDDIAKGIRGENDCEVEPREIARSFQATIADAIKNGTPYNPSNDLISREALKEAIQEREEEPNYQHDGETWQNGLYMAETLIDNAQAAPLLNEQIAWEQGYEAGLAQAVEITEEQAINKLHETGWLIGHDKEMTERPQGECRTCRHRDTEDKKCDCGALERQGCPFPVSDDYFCKFYEKGGAE